ncbi:L-threonylcarbamoyladenylate synthase [Haloarchaeobius iranensis]|uniref:L-threonylcarbamoyladenylate synthase n=1 Tax=Haloarchaeobius iranensis TaxID=996166 RepID=A0A1G9SFY7_9EURY|nr:L-threonylcarbamoyladenylate synthase [Haloarchaeobius iranensis]SDM34250.1 translation factor SUA5 [Haloarchaeobius iranensis]
MTDVTHAGEVLREGGLVVYPTETVYGLGADALDPEAVEMVFEAKERARDKPVSLGVPDVETATEHVQATDRETEFMYEFLPGPVTVLCQRREHVPDVLTAGREQVGVRVPDHATALALYRTAGTPVTATSANLSGRPSVTDPADLDGAFLEHVDHVVDDGPTDGTESTVVDVERGEIHRRGALADPIDAWLDRT